jgi:hypothetical protein
MPKTNLEIVEKMIERNRGILYFLIDRTKTLREQFFKQEFPESRYDKENDIVSINGIIYGVTRIVVNGEDFLIKDHEIVKCTPLT